MDTYIEITFKELAGNDGEMMIAMLAAIGYEGFEEQEHLLKAFIPQEKFDEAQLKRIAREKNLEYATSIIRQKNWNAIWEQSFEPVIIGNFCAIRASFHPPAPGVKYEITITPKMSFGTGHHATTYMMIEQMKDIDFSGKSVFDFGTGTGVLSILAEKMGAGSVEAIDNDEWSITNAKENLQVNNCTKVYLAESDYPVAAKVFDIVLANINKNIILLHLTAMTKILQANGTILLSGLLKEDYNEIRDALAENGFLIAGQQEKNNWICLQCKRSAD